MAELRFEGQNIKVEMVGSEEFLEEKGQQLVNKLLELDSKAKPSETKIAEVPVEIRQENNLAQYLRAFGGKSEKIRFLAIAGFLQNKGMKRLETGDIIKAVKQSNQKPFKNTSDCKAKCIQEGTCAKDERRTFYVTNLGFEMLKSNSNF
ncbi:MAG: hypothetical protein F4044_00060 [Rhodobacteraceae bacterium]|nr:hypothetical protein [Paracoccaceae bacterium]